MAANPHRLMSTDELQASYRQLHGTVENAHEEMHRICETLMDRIDRTRQALLTVKVNLERDPGNPAAIIAYVTEELNR